MTDLKQRVQAVVKNMSDQGVYISQYGNHAGQHSMFGLDEYYKRLRSETLLDTESIARTMNDIPFIFQSCSTWSTDNSYYFKHLVEDFRKRSGVNPDLDPYVTNGDFIVAMILCGHKPKFNGMVNCVFKVAMTQQSSSRMPEWR